MKILLAITTGRSNFKDTLDLLVKNFSAYGHFENNCVGVAVNYDCYFLNLKDEDFVYNTKLSKKFFEKIYIGQKHVSKYIELMKKRGVDEGIAIILSQSTGYSNKKNLVYLEAYKRGYDIVLFWDDDEYPYVCMIDGENISWMQTDILGAHLLAYKKYSADVAFGFFTGYASPIPSVLNFRLTKKTAIGLGDALSVASDVVNKDTFVDINKIFVGLKCENLDIKEIEMVDGGKWVSGGNISVSVRSVMNGIVPPFYTPSSTRADDTILSMGLERARVMQIPAGIFHDAFGEYDGIKTGIFPIKIERRKKNNYQVQRFCSALKGWLGYAPIFLRIKSQGLFRVNVKKMLKKILIIDDALSCELPELKKIFNKQKASSVFNGFVVRADRDYILMQKSYEEWKKISKVK